MIRTLAILGSLALFACGRPHYKNPHILIETRMGDIELELYPDQAPKTVAAFLSHIDSGYYTNASFYRILNEENQPSGSGASALIQGGIWKTNHSRAVNAAGIPHEPTNQTHILHKDGVISMARMGPGTASTEFFICIGDQPGFDYGGMNNPDGLGYAAFGKVVNGMDVVQFIYKEPESDQSFSPPIGILGIKKLP